MAGRRRVRRAVLHGQVLTYEDDVRPGALVVLIHGVGSSRATWDPVLPGLRSAGVHVLTVDLPGHGESAKGRGDYSLGALASTLRDLLDHLGYDRAVLVGHSLGGGVAMQFAYQFPERCAALVLVASGGLGPETNALLRAASLPGAELVIPWLSHPKTVSAIGRVGRTLGWAHIGPGLLSADSMTILARTPRSPGTGGVPRHAAWRGGHLGATGIGDEPAARRPGARPADLGGPGPGHPDPSWARGGRAADRRPPRGVPRSRTRAAPPRPGQVHRGPGRAPGPSRRRRRLTYRPACFGGITAACGFPICAR